MSCGIALLLFLFSINSFATEIVDFNIGADLTKCISARDGMSCTSVDALTKQPVQVELSRLGNTNDYGGYYNFNFSEEGYKFLGRVEVRKRGSPAGGRPKYKISITWIWSKTGTPNSPKGQPLGVVEAEELGQLNEISLVAPAIEEGFLTLTPWVRLGPVGR